MEMWEGFGGGGSGKTIDFTRPELTYFEIVEPWWTLRKHIIAMHFTLSDGSIYHPERFREEWWAPVDEYCAKQFSFFGNGFMHICYHVDRERARIEFRKKADAMLFKLTFA